MRDHPPNPTLRLSGKVAIITGGAGAVGRAAAALFVQHGASVVLVDSNEAGLERAVHAIGRDGASGVAADVTSPADTQRYVQFGLERHGRIDVFLANAGIEGQPLLIPECPIEEFDRVMSVNVRGVFLGLQQIIPAMANHGGGSIVITSSMFGYKGASIGSAAYTTSKHAVVGLMRSAALECASLGIRVNTVHPAYLDGPMMQRVTDTMEPEAREKFRQRLQKQIPLGRFGLPDDVAQLMLFLASDDSRFCTGGVYPVDGGMSAR